MGQFNAARIVLLSQVVGFAVCAAVFLHPESSPAQSEIDMPYFSSSEGVSQCASGYLVKGIACKGSYCDSKSLHCQSYSTTFDDKASYSWSGWFSDEDPHGYECPNGGYVSGVGCSGMYCDSIRIRCTNTSTKQASGNYRSTKYFSAGKEVCDQGQFVVGIRCKGKYCSTIQLVCR